MREKMLAIADRLENKATEYYEKSIEGPYNSHQKKHYALVSLAVKIVATEIKEELKG